MELKDYIEHWKVDLLRPTKSDVLVNINPGLNAISIDVLLSNIEPEKIHVAPSSLLKKIIKSNKLSEKTAGVSTLGFSSYAIQFSLAEKVFFAPVFIYNATPVFDRIKNKFEITRNSSSFFNPFLEKLLDLNLEEYSIETVESILLEKGLDFKLLDEVYLGNFHPHRFIILKEIEALSDQKKYNNALLELFGETVENQVECKLPNQNIFFTDDFQNRAIKDLQNHNIVLQGPPGTGKSDVITNIIAKSMAAKYKTLFIAEQQTAVNVIFEKLKTHQLHYFCAQLHHNLTAKEYVEDLKQTWKYLESLEKSKAVNMNRSYFMIQNLQMLLDKLNAKALYGGLSFGEFKDKCQQSNMHGKLHLNNLPELETWVKDRQLLKSVLPNVGKMQSYLWTYMNFSEHNSNDKRQKDFRSAYDAYQKMKDQLDKLNDFDDFQRKVMYAKLFFYDDKLLERKLFVKGTKLQIAFKKLRSQQKSLEEKIHLYTKEKENWNKELNESELFEFLEVLQSNDRFSLPNWIKKRELKKLSKINFNGAKKAIENLLHLKELEKKLVDTKAQLRELDLPDDLPSLDQINLLIDKSTSISENIFKQLIGLDNQKIIALYNCSSGVQLLADFIKRYLLFKPEIEWSLFFTDYQEYKETLAGSEEWLSKLSLPTKKMLFELRNNHEIQFLDKIVYQSHWNFLSAKFPELTALEPNKVSKILDEILEQEKQDQIDFAKSITYDLKCAFEEAHDLLQIPARKLSKEEKLRKARLRKGKSILVKQFAKSRNHLSPLELMQSEAAEWISLLKPIVSGSSISVAKNLPFEIEDFDLVLFDEASQINLSNAVGSIFRGKRIMVAGDSQQMPPSNLFNKGGSQDIDLLAQSTFYWENRTLQYHYRSHHDELIAFSNNYFYQNKLRAFPFYNADFPIEVLDLEGVFDDRVNHIEAEYAVKIISEKIKNDDFAFGIVAFSQKQLDAILAALPKSDYIKLMERENEILMSSLEHVQGEQCDHLIISLGYAFNKEGKFSHQFGPLNKDGGQRRLNVLMSRARKKITFIRSVNENDFKISENDGVDMLRKLMFYLTDTTKKHEQKLKNTNQPNNSFVFKSFYEEVPMALNLLSIHQVLNQRNWKIEYIF